MYRNPVEIIVSHLRQRGAHMIPGLIPEILPEISFERALQMPAEEYCARVMEKICRSAAGVLKTGEGLAVNYTDLPGGLIDKILDHFGIEPPPEDAEKMRRAAEFNAKNPVLTFSPDTAAKKREASAAAIRAADEFVRPIYEELEKLRKNAENSRV